MKEQKWYELENTENVVSPSLLVYPDRIEHNIASMVSMVNDIDLLRPHVKTHKTAEIVEMQMRHGIKKFKCATIAEAELLGTCGASDILLAMQPVGANIQRFLDLSRKYPDSKFSALVDNQNSLNDIAALASKNDLVTSLWMDVNVGMNRTGILPGDEAFRLFQTMDEHKNLSVKGLHVYDGHIRNTDLEKRKTECDLAFEKVLRLKEVIESKGVQVREIVAGGSPTFPIHAKREGVETSPGTTLLWDARYSELFPDMPFLKAAVLLIRVLSKPAPNTLCFDLGHKMIACEMEFPRLQILGLEESSQIGQSEEHLVVETHRAGEFEVGDIFYGIPMHICPTVAKYENLLTVQEGQVTGKWKVAARNQKISI